MRTYPYLPPDVGGGWSGYPYIVFPRADLSFENKHDNLGLNEAKFKKLSLHLAEALDVHIGRQHTFADELRAMSHKDRILTIALMGVMEVGIMKGAKLVGGAIYTTAKLYLKDPNMRFFTHRWLNSIKVPVAQRAGWLYASRSLSKLSGSRNITSNPIYRTLAESGATIFKGKAWNNRLKNLQGFKPEFEIDFDVQERLKRFLREEDKESQDREDDMPYNRRTGQWYPARRRGGYSNNYSRGGSSRSSSSGGGYNRRSYGGGGYAQRRRSYRRW